MAEKSNMISLGTKAPDFRLEDVCTGRYLSLAEAKSDTATVIMFICNHCPYVKYIRPTLVGVAKHYQTKDVKFIAINSNDIESYPDDSPEKMREEAINHQFPFPYLFDPTQEVAKAYHAACTPDFYVFNKHLECVYRGRFDDATPGNQHTVTGVDLRNALDNIIAQKPINQDQKPSIGCSIKWKKH